jgi:HEAT repeat protein
VKLVAIDVIRSIGEQSPQVVRALVRLLKDTDREVRGNAIIALDRMGPDRKEAVPALVGMLGENYKGPRFGVAGNVREVTAWTLGRIGPEAAAAVPELTRLLADPYVRMREEAAAALAHIQRDTNSVRLLVEQFDRSWDFQECEGLLAAFRELGPLAKGAAPAVLEKFNSPGKWRQLPDLQLREAAIQTLAEIDPDAVWKAHFGSPFAVSEAPPQPLPQRSEIGLPNSIPTGLFEQPPGLKLKQQ